MSVDEFLQAQEANIRDIETAIRDVLADTFYPGMRETWLQNGLLWLERMDDTLQERTQSHLRTFVDQGITEAKRLYKRVTSEPEKYQRAIQEKGDSSLLTNYLQMYERVQRQS